MVVRKPTSRKANLTENAPRSMPQMVWAMVGSLFLAPVLQDAGRLLGDGFRVSGFSSVRPVSTMAVIFFFTRPASPVATMR